MRTLFPLTFRSSMLSDFESCQLKGFRSHIQHLRYPAATKSHHLVAGACFAYGVEQVRRCFYEMKYTMEDSIEMGAEAILGYEDTKDSIKSNERLAQCLRRYFKKYPLDNDLIPVALQDGKYAIEYPWEFETDIDHPDFPDRKITIAGKLDGLYNRMYKGNSLDYYIVDEKTCSSIYRVPGTGAIDYIKEEAVWKYRQQFLLYSFACVQLYQLGILERKPKATLVYKIPVMKEVEQPYELEIPFSERAVEIYSATLFNNINELKERYLYLKQTGKDPWTSFNANFGEACTSWGRECQYGSGCLDKNGESILTTQMVQQVVTDYDKAAVPLEMYLQQLKSEV